MNSQTGNLPVEAAQDLHVFRRCLPMALRLQESLRFLSDGTEGRRCLDIGAGNAVLSYHLRTFGGEWHTVPAKDQSVDAVRAVLGENVHEPEEGRLPFADKLFDVLVVFEGLQEAADEDGFIAECHRVMKPDGRLILHVDHAKPLSLLRPVQHLLQMNYDRRGLARAGYTESDLFALLKHGFDVYQVRSYMRFFLAFTHTVVQAVLRRGTADADPAAERVQRVFSVANVFYRIAFQLDMLVFFSRGYQLVAMAKRRAWRPRKAPVLVDGRSITEVVLSRAAG